MTKVKNIIIVLVLNYTLMLFVSVFFELNAINNKAVEIQNYIATSADLALQQTQFVGDFMDSNSDSSFSLKMPNSDGRGYKNIDLFEGLYGLNSKNEVNRDMIYRLLYDNNDFKMLASRSGVMKVPVKYYNYDKTGMTWYYMPKVAMVGSPMLPNLDGKNGIVDLMGNPVPDSFAKELLRDYGLNDYKRISGGEEYYTHPLNIGVTYINEDLLSALFVNNMDVIMRSKYTSKDMSSYEGGNGLLKGSTFSQNIKDTDTTNNPIHNGNFTFFRGQQRLTGGGGVGAYEGIKPTVVYKVIDMYDSANDSLLVELFGANKGGYSTKAEYLQQTDSEILNPVTRMPYTSKPIVVAKVTFYADIVVPYTTVLVRELADYIYGSESSHKMGIKNENGTDVRRMSYTTYFAVKP